MMPTTNKRPFSFIFAIFVTAFVTACVKNGAKDQPAPIIKNQTLETETLSESEINGDKFIRINESSDQPIQEITKDFKFSIDKIYDIGITDRSNQNDECRTKTRLNYEFFIINEDNGNEELLDNNRLKPTRLAGDYRLRVRMTNEGFCKKISMSFKLDLKERTDLVATEDIDMGIKCNTVIQTLNTENTKILRGYAELHSSPLFMNHFKREKEMILGNNTICNKPIPENTRCFTNDVPARKKENPIVAKNIICYQTGNERPVAQSYLQINRKFGDTTANLSCMNGKHHLTYKFDSCSMNYRFGREVPVDINSYDISFEKGKIKLSYETDEESMGEFIASRDNYIMIFYRNEDQDMRPFLESQIYVPLKDLLEGDVELKVPGVLRTIRHLDIKAKDFKFVFSRRAYDVLNPDITKRGFHHIDLGKVCRLNQSGISIIAPGGDAVRYCE